MRKLPIVIDNDMLFNAGINLLSDNEMLNVRGGGEPVRPKSRPREQFDWEGDAPATSGVLSAQGTEQPSLIDYIKDWFKNWKQ
jgi:hypothetical protein